MHVQRHVVDSEWYQVVDRIARCVISTDDLGCCTVLLKKQLAMRLCLADQLRKRLVGALFKSVYVTSINGQKRAINLAFYSRRPAASDTCTAIAL